MKKAKNITYSLSFRIISSIVFLLLVFSTIASTIGYIRFTDSLTKEYNDSAFRTAETAVTLINGDKIEEYLARSGHCFRFSETTVCSANKNAMSA